MTSYRGTHRAGGKLKKHGVAGVKENKASKKSKHQRIYQRRWWENLENITCESLDSLFSNANIISAAASA